MCTLPEVIKGLKTKSMSLFEKTNQTGYAPMVKKQGTQGIHKQAVLIKNINPGLVANASMNLLTSVVGQQQLVAIQSSLTRMEEQLGTLLQNRHNDFWGSAESRFLYFKEVVSRYRSRGINLDGVEDRQIEMDFRDAISDVSKLHTDIQQITKAIDGLNEVEFRQKWKEATLIKKYESEIQHFNEKQALIKLNIEFIKQCYEPYLIAVRKVEQESKVSEISTELINKNHLLVEQIEQKVDSIEKNFKVKFAVTPKKYIEKNLNRLKENVPLRMEIPQTLKIEIPDEVIVEIGEDEKVYMHLPKLER